MAKSLVIVESPAKAKTINKFLGRNFLVKAAMGHVRDLPKSKLGVDVANGFTPNYVVIPQRKKVLMELKKAAEKVDDVYLAPDPDREGEAICYHLARKRIEHDHSQHNIIEMRAIEVNSTIWKHHD